MMDIALIVDLMLPEETTETRRNIVAWVEYELGCGRKCSILHAAAFVRADPTCDCCVCEGHETLMPMKQPDWDDFPVPLGEERT